MLTFNIVFFCFIWFGVENCKIWNFLYSRSLYYGGEYPYCSEAKAPNTVTIKLSEENKRQSDGTSRIVETRIQMDYSTKLAVFQKYDAANNCQIWEKQVETSSSGLMPSSGYLFPMLTVANSSNNGDFVSGMVNTIWIIILLNQTITWKCDTELKIMWFFWWSFCKRKYLKNLWHHIFNFFFVFPKVF